MKPGFVSALLIGLLALAGTRCGGGKAADEAPIDTPEQLAQVGQDAILLLEKNTPSLYFGDGRTATLLWDMSGTEAIPTSKRFPGLFLLDVRINFETINGISTATGYVFTNPRVQMLTGEQEAVITGVVVRVNGQLYPGTENFLSATKTAKGIDSVNIYGGSVRAKLPQVSSSDVISVAFSQLELRARTDNPPTPPTPNMTVPNPFTSRQQVPITISNDGTARRWCLTAYPIRPVSTNDPCPGYVWLATRPTQFDLITVGRLVNSGETVQFYLWVANSDLKISATAATASVTFDSTAPSAPALASVTVTDSQMASLDGLTTPNEPVTWCIKEAATQNSVQEDNGCSYSATKPNYVGLKGGGTRYVRVFVQDRAGNKANSPVRSVNNPFGAISFAQLTDAAQGARAVFANNCMSCHGAGGANQAEWDATSYTATVAKKNQILQRIESAATPMPPTGMLDEKQRGLIRLWFTQTSTPVQN